MTKILLAIILLAIILLVALMACSDDDKPPVVTYMPDGSFHIDRLDPGESVRIPLPLSAGMEEPIWKMTLDSNWSAITVDETFQYEFTQDITIFDSKGNILCVVKKGGGIDLRVDAVEVIIPLVGAISSVSRNIDQKNEVCLESIRGCERAQQEIERIRKELNEALERLAVAKGYTPV